MENVIIHQEQRLYKQFIKIFKMRITAMPLRKLMKAELKGMQSVGILLICNITILCINRGKRFAWGFRTHTATRLGLFCPLVHLSIKTEIWKFR